MNKEQTPTQRVERARKDGKLYELAPQLATELEAALKALDYVVNSGESYERIQEVAQVELDKINR